MIKDLKVKKLQGIVRLRMSNPFTIGIVQTEDEFCNRKEEREELNRFAQNGSKVLIYSPRRFGKSSLVTLVLKDLRKKGFLTAYVDLFPVTSEHDFVVRVASAVFKGFGQDVSPKSLIEKIKGIFSSIRPIIEVSPEGYSISAKYDPISRSQMPLDDLMEGLYNYVKKMKLPACIALDEFQEITELPEVKRIEGTLRSHIQFQKEISYFYIGSRRRILQDMFNNRARPFYKSASSYELKPIAKDHFVPFIEKRFSETGKFCSKVVAEDIYVAADGYPYYVQKLAAIVWDITEKESSKELVKQALTLLIKSEAVDFEGQWGSLSLSQRALLKAIACESTPSPYSKEFLVRHDLSVGGAQKALKILIAKDFIEKSADGFYKLTDPIMVAWLKL